MHVEKVNSHEIHATLDVESFMQISQSIFAELSEEMIVQKYLTRLSSVIPVSFCALSLKPRGPQEYWWAAGYYDGRSLSARLLDKIADLSERQLAAQVLANPVLPLQQYPERCIELGSLQLHNLNLGAVVAIPVQTARQQLGILLAGKEPKNPYSHDEQRCLCLLAGQLAQALETASLKERTRERDREFELIYQTGQRITQLLDLKELTAQLVKEVSETFGYESVTLLLANEETRELIVEATHGLSKERHLGFRIPITDELDGGIVGLVAKRGKTYIAGDVQRDKRYIKTVDETRSEVDVPLLIKGRVIGVLDVQSTKVEAFTEKDQHILEMLADQMAIALENARLYEELAGAHSEIQQTSKQLQRLLERTVKIQEQERQRIAADIHDNVNQLIYGAIYEAQAALQSLPASDTSVKENLRNIQASLDVAHSEIRKAIFNLWPTSLDEMGLIPSLRSLVSGFGKTYDVKSAVELSGTPIAFEPLAQINIYRIVQEALHNVQKHACATNVRILLDFSDTTVTLCVADDGVGFNWEGLIDEADRHLGLISMRERARSIGGKLKVVSAPEEGTLLRFEFPRSMIKQGSEHSR